MAVKKKYDVVFLAILSALILAGFFILSSASLGLAARAGKNSYSLVLKQIALGGGVGSVLFLITSRINYKSWKKLSLPLFLFSLLLTLLVFIPYFGLEHGGAKRWIVLGFLSFQPAEILKFSFVVYLSSWLSKKQKEISSFKEGFFPFLLIISFVALALIFQPDLGTLGVICIVAGLMFFLAGGRYTQISLFIVIGLVSLSLLALIKPYAMDRITVFLDNTQDIQGVGYQINQAKIAIGSGGLLGKGFGEGLSKFNYLPEPVGDSIFAVAAEEFGFLGTSLLILLFLVFFWKCLHIAFRAPDRFGRLLASGIAILIIVQSFINMYATVGLMPLTGLPLIFISQGGTALAITLAEAGILLNVSKQGK